MAVQQAAVIGAGTMGAEIALVIAEHGVPVVLKEIAPQYLERGLRQIDALLQRRVERGRLRTEEAQAARARIHPTLEEQALTTVDFVIEAVPEQLALKQAVFRDLGRLTPPHAVLATNTSSLPVHELAQASGRPANVIGFHFFNPASVMRLVEVVVTAETAEATVATALAFARQIGKLPVRVRECPGFLVNRILVAGMVEGMRYQQEQRAALDAVDRALREQARVPMGPFQLADLVGLDIVAEIGGILEAAYGERFQVPPIVRELVAQGRLGQKSGGGFYQPDGTPLPLGDQPVEGEQLVQRVLAAGFLEAYRCLEEGIASPDEIDLAMQAGAGWPLGPLTWAEQQGLPRVVALLQRLAATVGPRFTPPASLVERAARGEPLRPQPTDTPRSGGA
ncbi:MAG: 3-hydroxyacyl-CoA dehydrogenase [Chloroflexi bacterium]|nr:3-hydroxyacyl-CoA dehydrogenase [Chloroflexota bacterium]